MFRVYIIAPLALLAIAALYWSQLRGGAQHVSGVVEAEDVRVGSLVGGRLARVCVREGQQVARGELLIVLEPHDWNERLAQAEATLAAATARADEVSAGPRPEELAQARARRDRAAAVLARRIAGPRPLEIQILEQRVARAEADLRKAEFDHNRLTELMSQGAGATEELARARRDLDSATAAVAGARDELALAREGTRTEDIAEARAELATAEAGVALLEAGSRQEQIRWAQAQAQAAQAAVESIRRQLAETSIYAPLNCVVEAIDIQPGDLVAPGAPLLTLLDAENLYVRAYVPQHRLDITVGTPLQLRADALPDQAIAGVVSFVSRGAEFTPSNVQTPEERVKQVYRVKIKIEPSTGLRPGMTVDVLLGAANAR